MSATITGRTGAVWPFADRRVPLSDFLFAEAAAQGGPVYRDAEGVRLRVAGNLFRVPGGTWRLEREVAYEVSPQAYEVAP